MTCLKPCTPKEKTPEITVQFPDTWNNKIKQ